MTGVGCVADSRAFHLIEVESWPECREIVVEGALEVEGNAEFEACLRRALESEPDYLLLDLDRCRSIDAPATKQLVVLRQMLQDQRRELLVFGAVGQVRRMLEDIGAFDCDPPPPTPRSPRRRRGPALLRSRRAGSGRR